MKTQHKITPNMQIPRRVVAGFLITLLAGTGCSSSIKSLTVEVKNIYYPDYNETITTTMNTEEYIGDTNYSFKAVEFYPAFSILESTKKIVSLSDEPINPAFKMKVYEDGKLIEETWAFYGSLAPHFSSSSILIFQVSSFEYKGQVYENKKEPEENENVFTR
jgi:hypothetical protein